MERLLVRGVMSQLRTSVNDMKQKKLRKRIDFVYENGFVVLTRSYLLKRGFCCKNGCKNCPYSQEKVSEVSKISEGEM